MNLKEKTGWLMLAFLSVVTTGCKKNDYTEAKEKDHYNQYYSIEFDKTSNTISAIANFSKYDDQYKEYFTLLPANRVVRLNGKSGTPNTKGIPFYEWSVPGNIQAFSFAFDKGQGDIITNDFPIDKIPDFELVSFPDSITSINGNSFDWKSMGSNEKDIDIRIYDSSDTKGYQQINGFTTADTHIVFAPPQLTRSKNGYAYIEFSRDALYIIDHRDGPYIGRIRISTRLMKRIPYKK